MAKITIIFVVGVALIFGLEFFEIMDVPYFEIPDFFSSKAELTEKANQALEANQ